MPQYDDEGPVFYREIQKSAYLKRVPNESGGSKLIPLGNKKTPPKPLWTQLCVHNGRAPYLEQYISPPRAASHAPVWRASLARARHVTAGVGGAGGEHEFLIHTDEGLVRMRAQDWDSMQDWVRTLRSKLHSLQILGGGENVYAPPPTPPAPPAAPRPPARDPTSPLPPTPAVPIDRVPGIELTPVIRQIAQPTIQETEENQVETTPVTEQQPDTTTFTPTIDNHIETAEIDISDWDSTLDLSSMPSTSQNKEKTKSVAKICGQNICLDDSVLKRNVESEDFDTESNCESTVDNVDIVESAKFEENSDVFVKDNFTRVIVNRETVTSNGDEETSQASDYQGTNITVIQVSNKPPHTAIPVLGSERQVFNFDIKPELPKTDDKYVNIVNTENGTQTSENDYGTIFSTTKNDSEYGHLSLTTTVDFATNNSESLYERLCMASTSNDIPSPLPLRKLKLTEKSRKSSLPNLDLEAPPTTASAYEYLFPGSNPDVAANNNTTNSTTVNFNSSNTRSQNVNVNHRVEVNSNATDQVNVSVASISSSRPNLPGCKVNRNNITNDRRIERSLSQNENDQSANGVRRHISPILEGNKDKPEVQNTKPIWKRGLTEFSLLSKLRGLGQKRPDSPTRLDHGDRAANSSIAIPVKVLRGRAECRLDASRRRSNSLSNGVSAPPAPPPPPPLASHAVGPARARRVRPTLVAHDGHVWVASWRGSRRGQAGDRLVAINGVAPRDVPHAHSLLSAQHQKLDILFHRVPLAVLFILKKERDDESIGVKVDSECTISMVVEGSPASRAGLPAGAWGLTEVNGRPVNLIKGGQDDVNRLSGVGRDVSILIQPAVLVRKIRNALKSNKNILGLR